MVNRTPHSNNLGWSRSWNGQSRNDTHHTHITILLLLSKIASSYLVCIYHLSKLILLTIKTMAIGRQIKAHILNIYSIWQLLLWPSNCHLGQGHTCQLMTCPYTACHARNWAFIMHITCYKIHFASYNNELGK